MYANNALEKPGKLIKEWHFAGEYYQLFFVPRYYNRNCGTFIPEKYEAHCGKFYGFGETAREALDTLKENMA